MKDIKLTRAHNGRAKGAVVTVDDMRAAKMIEAGIGKPATKPNPQPKR